MPIPSEALAFGSAFFLSCGLLSAQVNVLTYHNDCARTGQNSNEVVLTRTNVNAGAFGKLFSYPVDGYVYAQPLYVAGVQIPGQGTHNVIYVATEHNSVYAFDADSNVGPSGGLLWQTNLGPSVLTPDPNFGYKYGPYDDIWPEIGITGTPVIDLASGSLYVDACTHEGTNYIHRLHALSLINGAEQANSPVVVSATVPGTGVDSTNGQVTFNPMQENQRPALTLVGGVLYVGYAGYGDTDPFHGWLIGFDPTTLNQLTNYTFNTTPNSTINNFGSDAGEGGIWMAGCGISADAETNLYFAVGNGSFNGTDPATATEFGDSFMKLSTGGGLVVTDYFTPFNQATLQSNDTDVGSGGVVLLPDQAGPFPHLLVGAGKQGRIYLINRDQMTQGNIHYDFAHSQDHIVQSLDGIINASFDTPAYFNGSIYYGGTDDYLKQLPLELGQLSTFPNSVGARVFPFPGTTPSVSANGTNNGIVWAIQMGTPAVLTAYNSDDLTTELYNSSQAAGQRDRLTNSVKFAVPTIANGTVIVGNQYSVSVFGLLAGVISFTSTAYVVQEGQSFATITVLRAGGTQGTVQVNYSTADGSALAGLDYTNVAGTLTWTNGETGAKTFQVPIIDDAQGGPSTSLNLILSGPTGGASLGTQSTAVLHILEDAFDLWRWSHFSTNITNFAVAGPYADPDQDGAVNLLEFALATDPNVANGQLSLTASLIGSHLEVQFHRNTAATNLTYTVQAANTLGNWTDLVTYTNSLGWVAKALGTTSSESAPIGVFPDQYTVVSITDPADLSTNSAGSRFLRLKVSLN